MTLHQALLESAEVALEALGRDDTVSLGKRLEDFNNLQIFLNVTISALRKEIHAQIEREQKQNAIEVGYSPGHGLSVKHSVGSGSASLVRHAEIESK